MKKIILALCCFSAIDLLALPPTFPGSGAIEREIQKDFEVDRILEGKQIPSIQIDIPEERLELPAGGKYLIDQIILEGNDSVLKTDIIEYLQLNLHQELSLQQMDHLCQKIEQYYAKKGYFLARAYLPVQEIADQTLKINIIEGRLGNVQVIGNQFYSAKFIRGYFSSLVGKPLSYNQFLKAVSLLNDNQDIYAGAIFEKGKEFGHADVIIRVKDSRPAHLSLNLNNYGRPITSNTRMGGKFEWGNLITYGDKFSVTEVLGLPFKSLYFTDIGYKVPINYKGTTLQTDYLTTRFKVEQLKSLELRGESDIASLKLNQAFIRNRKINMDGFASFDYKQIRNYQAKNRQSYDKLRCITLGTSIDHTLSNSARSIAQIRLGVGVPGLLKGSKFNDEVDTHSNIKKSFFKINADYDFLQTLPRQCYLSFHGSGQYSFNKLPVPEQLYIGGSDSVRGFPLSKSLGDSGYYMNLELRSPIPGLSDAKFFRTQKSWKEVIQLGLFVDHGGTFMRSDYDAYLWGSGLSLKLNALWNTSLSLDIGFPLNHRGEGKDRKSCFTYLKLTTKAF
jgi:hemolysin activation/secretion protein